ncbi:NTE family protein [Faunimonas pinastri]|uniref:NTE family protein n=1 Tax=Faunimonas pinastri TaxID=1855383 RepID=A0A1H9G010_9HYPH|nr:patatin-like phospholipase family protein [Faunimonas pinastri]SEQ43480.1 NTE family protein [Faunimonas pinastri]
MSERDAEDRAGAASPINLALQGGGAHGAFTWGVLDRLLEEDRFSIEGISGCSAGAMNAVCLADGFARGGADGARETLHDFWRAMGQHWWSSPVPRTMWDRLTGSWSLENSPAFLLFDVASRFYSPYDLNPLNINPLLETIREQIDFDRVRASGIKVFISATNVIDGSVKVFSGPELSAEAVMASACLPHVFQAVEIDGVPYWDGGYMGNPSLFPLFYETVTEDILLVQINPVERREVPRSAREILNRLDEITFNASLMSELRSIDFVSRLVDEGKLDRREYKRIRLHAVAADAALNSLSTTSKYNTEWDFLTHLRDLGRAAATDWLESGADAVGLRPGIDLSARLAPGGTGRGAPEGQMAPHLRETLSRVRTESGWRRNEGRDPES